MDTRKALQQNYVLRVTNHENGAVVYTIDREIGRGGSCIVYEAVYMNNAGAPRKVRIKECYPFRLQIKRNAEGKLVPLESDAALYEKYRQKFRAAFVTTNVFFETSGLTNSTVNTLDIYEANNTFYTVTAYEEGDVLAYDPARPLQSRIAIVRSAAEVISRIHRKGYLYLDIKPENIFVFQETSEMVRLFDFDSPVPQQNGYLLEPENIGRISFTKGFAAPEIQSGTLKHIGVWSDVYGIGALLFYLLFGRVPDALDCDADAEYDYEIMTPEAGRYQDKLYRLLTAFFHRTLAGFRKDRFFRMEGAVDALDELYRIADPHRAFLRSTVISVPGHCIGREKELGLLEQWFYGNGSNCMFVTGMGGIGKSTIIRQFLSRHRRECDALLYLNAAGSLRELIADDDKVSISTVEKYPEEKTDEYYNRKLRALKKICAGSRILLAIDNYEGQDFKELCRLMEIGWKIVIISRTFEGPDDCGKLEVGPLETEEELSRLFVSYLPSISRKKEKNIPKTADLPEREQQAYISRIIHKVQGHTLTLELIARQIACSYLTLEEAAELADSYGFSGISEDRIRYIKDRKIYHETLLGIISAVLDVSGQTKEEARILKGLSLFGDDGISLQLFLNFLNLSGREDIHLLVAKGWIRVEHQTLFMHPVIREIVDSRSWEENYMDAALPVMEGLCGLLPERTDFSASDDFRLIEKNCRLVEQTVEICRKWPLLYKSQDYARLLYHLLTNLPREREIFLINNGKELIQRWTRAAQGQEPESAFSEEAMRIMRLYEIVLYAYLDREEWDKAWEQLEQIKNYAKKTGSDYFFGRYYDLEGEYYDCRQNGRYDPEFEDENGKLLIQSMDQAIFYMQRSMHPDSGKKLARFMTSRCIIMMRGEEAPKEKIQDLLEKAGLQTEKYCEKYSLETLGYLNCCAWYQVLVESEEMFSEPSPKKTSQRPSTEKISQRPSAAECPVDLSWARKAQNYLEQSAVIAAEIYPENQDFIESFLIPAADMNFECALRISAAARMKNRNGQTQDDPQEKFLEYLEKSVSLLERAVQICDRYPDVFPYIRKKAELYSHLIEVYCMAEKYRKCEVLLEMRQDLDEAYGLNEQTDPRMLAYIREKLENEEEQSL